MKVLITGGAGFIGSHLVDHHINVGDTVSVIDNLSTGSRENISHHFANPRFSFHQGALEQWADLDMEVSNSDLIYHMAAIVGVVHVMENPVELINVNQNATEKLLRSVVLNRPGAKVLITSSSEVYGVGNKQQFSEDDDVIIPSQDQLRWCYAATKLSDEMLAFAYHHQYDLQTITVRLFNTVGRRQSARYGMVLPHFIEQALANRPITVYGNGEQSRSFCDIRDTVKMLTLLINHDDVIGQIVNIGSNDEVSINNLAKLVKAQAESSSQIKHISYEEAYGIAFEDISHRCPDLKKLYSLINYRAEFDLCATINYLLEPHAAQDVSDGFAETLAIN